MGALNNNTPRMHFGRRVGTVPKGPLTHRRYDTRNFHITLRQWRIFHAVYDSGGFTEAGALLHLSQSTISYTIAKLQEQLGVPVFKIEGHRTALTEAGRVILERSRGILEEALDLELLVERLRSGSVPNIVLMVERDFPRTMLNRAVRAFSEREPRANLLLEALPPTWEDAAQDDQRLALNICSKVPEGYVCEPLIAIDFVAVARAKHMLASSGTPLSRTDLHRHEQIAIGGRSGTPARSVQQNGGSRVREVPDLEAALKALHGSDGYMWLPRHLATPALLQQNLGVLPLDSSESCTRHYYLAHRPEVAHEAVMTRLSRILKSELARSIDQGA